MRNIPLGFAALVAFAVIFVVLLWALNDGETPASNGLLPTSHALSPTIVPNAAPQQQAPAQAMAMPPPQPLPQPTPLPTPPQTPSAMPQALMDTLMQQPPAAPTQQSMPANGNADSGDRDATPSASAVSSSLRGSLGIPHQVDANTTILDIHGEGNSIAYVFGVNMTSTELLPVVDGIRHNMKDNACTRDDFKQLLQHGFSITLRFHASDGSEAVPVVIPNNTCN